MCVYDGDRLECFKLERMADDFCFEDSDWKRLVPNLKPLGLSCLLNSNCGRETHASGVLLAVDRLCGEVSPLHKLSMACFCCLCGVSDAIGFSHSALTSFERRAEVVELFCYSSAEPAIVNSVIVADPSGMPQCFSKGTLRSIIARCSHVFDGREVRMFTSLEKEELLRQARVWETEGRTVLGMSFCSSTSASAYSWVDTYPAAGASILRYIDDAPVSLCITKDGSLKSHVQWGPGRASAAALDSMEFASSVQESLHTQQVLIGVVSTRYSPLPDVSECVEALGDSGTRFVTFSEESERVASRFGEDIGIDLGWNCVISLNSEIPPPDFRVSSPGGGHHLPVGLPAIQRHLDNVDDIPLRVPLFADADEASVSAMIREFSSRGMQPLVVGNAVKSPLPACVGSNIASAMLMPAKRKWCLSMSEHNPTRSRLVDVGGVLQGLVSPLLLPAEGGFKLLLSIMRAGRNSQQAKRCGRIFLLHAAFLIALCELGIACLGLKQPLITFPQYALIVGLFVPILAVSVVVASSDTSAGAIMKQMPEGNGHMLTVDVASTLLLVFPTAVVICLQGLLGSDACQSQAAAGALITAALIVVSGAATSKHATVWEAPLSSVWWRWTAVGLLAVQSLVSSMHAVSCSATLCDTCITHKSWVPWAMLSWVLFMVLIALFLRRMQAKKWKRSQLFSRLTFNTRLGRDSPI